MIVIKRSLKNRITRVTLLATLALAATAAVAIASIVPKASGTYTNRGVGTANYRYISFQVTKHGSTYEVKNFGINCFANNNNIGAVYAKNLAKVSSTHTFSYKGAATEYHNGQPEGSATLDITGKFVSSTKATGKVTYTAKSKLSGCPGSSFSAYWAK